MLDSRTPRRRKYVGTEKGTYVSGCALVVVTYSGPDVGFSQNPPPSAPASQPDQPTPKIPNDELVSLVAPIALCPDPLLRQVLVVPTYPLELIQLQQYLGKNKTLKGKELTDAVSKQDWDPSIQAGWLSCRM